MGEKHDSMKALEEDCSVLQRQRLGRGSIEVVSNVQPAKREAVSPVEPANPIEEVLFTTKTPQ